MSTTPYAVACKGCSYVEQYAYDPETGVRTTTPLTPQGRVPIYCPKCGARSWRVPATAEDIAKYEAAQRRLQRATELCRKLDMDGLFKIPEEIRAAPEVKNALSNLLAPLEGETLKVAQTNVLKAARAGVQVDSDVWVDMYDRAVQKAVQATKGAKAVA